eukprot:COSAG02_NODE_5_length_66751_cov_63.939148_2_plen_95_part_00
MRSGRSQQRRQLTIRKHKEGSSQFENITLVIFFNVVEMLIFSHAVFCQAYIERSFAISPGAVAAANIVGTCKNVTMLFERYTEPLNCEDTTGRG